MQKATELCNRRQRTRRLSPPETLRGGTACAREHELRGLGLVSARPTGVIPLFLECTLMVMAATWTGTAPPLKTPSNYKPSYNCPPLSSRRLFLPRAAPSHCSRQRNNNLLTIERDVVEIAEVAADVALMVDSDSRTKVGTSSVAAAICALALLWLAWTPRVLRRCCV